MKHLYEDGKTTEQYLCEDEVRARDEYELAKIKNMRMQTLIEKENKRGSTKLRKTKR